MIKTLLKLGVLLVVALGLSPIVVASTNEPCASIESRLRIGPFYERRIMSDGGHFYALRPFYAHSSDSEEREDVTDAVWPLATGHWDQTQFWWRCLLAFGNDLNVDDENAGYECGVFPFWLNGRSREGEDYWSLFPIYGHVPKFMMFMSDIDFILFPCYLKYNVVGRERRYYLFPFIGREDDEQLQTHTSIFQFFGEKENRMSSSRFILWPFWTEKVYKDATRNPGQSWMFFPAVGHVAREKEEQWLTLPPFFSWAKTDKRERWHMPWPFVQVDNSDSERKRVFWPFYSQALGEERTFYSAGWFLFSYEDMRMKKQRYERTRFFPFYAHETRYAKNDKGEEVEKEDYLRVWPFVTRQRTPDYFHWRTLELNPIRSAGGIDRNWAPFWTFYAHNETANETEHDGLWGILNFRVFKGSATNQPPSGLLLPVNKPVSTATPGDGVVEELEGLLR
jgi:hypothetical protein